jgi:hypothetical protein
MIVFSIKRRKRDAFSYLWSRIAAVLPPSARAAEERLAAAADYLPLLQASEPLPLSLCCQGIVALLFITTWRRQNHT